MLKYIFHISICSFCFCLYIFLFGGGSANLNPAQEDDAFAKIENGEIIFVADTVEYKEFVSYKLFNGKNIVFDQIKIVHKKTLGDGKEFYYLELSTQNRDYKVAKWLNKKDNNFYLNNTISEAEIQDFFEQTYLICIGNTDCSPNVYQDGNSRIWGCGDAIECYISEEAAKQSGCESFKVI